MSAATPADTSTAHTARRPRWPAPAVRTLAAATLALTLVACDGTPGGGADAGTGPPCPLAAPASGAACDGVGRACVYERCAGEGIVRASCAPADGGAGAWLVSASPCAASCGGTACAAPSVCAERIGGALLAQCATHACGEGPLDCACACGPGIECTLAASTEGAVFGCYVGCGAAICP